MRKGGGRHLPYFQPLDLSLVPKSSSGLRLRGAEGWGGRRREERQGIGRGSYLTGMEAIGDPQGDPPISTVWGLPGNPGFPTGLCHLLVGPPL